MTMTDKEKYTMLTQRYWEAETTPEEERALARYAAQTDDPAFAEIRAVLGYLSVGRAKKARRGRKVRLYTLAAAAASVAVVVTFSLGLLTGRGQRTDDLCIRYAYGVQTNDSEAIMASVASSLADFFAGDTPAETQLLEMFQR